MTTIRQQPERVIQLSTSGRYCAQLEGPEGWITIASGPDRDRVVERFTEFKANRSK